MGQKLSRKNFWHLELQSEWLVVFGLCDKVLVAGGGYTGGFCEKLPEASPMSDRANDSWLQDGPAAGQGQACQRWG